MRWWRLGRRIHGCVTVAPQVQILPVNTVTVINVSVHDSSASVNPVELAVALEALQALQAPQAPQLDLDGSPVRLAGGFWAEMWVLCLTHRGPQLPQQVVLRLAPDSNASTRETVIQRGVAEQGYPTPAILASGDATAATRAWSVMTYAAGRPLLAGLSGLGALARLPRLARSLPRQLAVSMATLHSLDPAPIETALSTLADTDGSVAGTGGVDGMLERFSAQAVRLESSSLITTVQHLVSTAPQESRRVICHGDLHPFNILDDNGTITVLDWTAALVADPAFDISYTAMLLANAPLQAPRIVQPVINAAARAVARHFIREYRKATGTSPHDAERLAWYTKLHATRIALEIAEWRSSGTVGDHSDHPWLNLEPIVQRLLSTI